MRHSSSKNVAISHTYDNHTNGVTKVLQNNNTVTYKKVSFLEFVNYLDSLISTSTNTSIDDVENAVYQAVSWAENYPYLH